LRRRTFGTHVPRSERPMPPSGSRRAALRAQQSRKVEHLTAANGIIKTSDRMCRRSNRC
jgi:hypothetical protein